MGTTEYLEMLKLMKRWADNGTGAVVYCLRRIMPKTLKQERLLLSKRTTHDKWSGYITRIEEEGNQDWEIEFVPTTTSME